MQRCIGGSVRVAYIIILYSIVGRKHIIEHTFKGTICISITAVTGNLLQRTALLLYKTLSGRIQIENLFMMCCIIITVYQSPTR